MNKEEILDRYCYLDRVTTALRDTRPCPISIGFYKMTQEGIEQEHNAWYKLIDQDTRDKYDSITRELVPMWEEMDKLRQEILSWGK